MQVVVCAKPGELQLAERPLPERSEGEVLVRIRRVGICGTDMHIYCGNQPFLTYPRVMGHELSGEVVEAPEGSDLRPGDPVYVIPYLSCGTCVACRRDKPNCCTDIAVLGVHRDGGLAQYLNVPESAVKRADGISLDQAAMVEFLSVGAHAVRRGSVGPEDHVLVVGAGPIGMAVALFAKLKGAQVAMLDVREDRLAFCTDHLGVDATVTAGDGAKERLASLTDNDFFDIVFDATGNAKAMEAGFGYVAHGGAYVLVSIVPADITFSDPEFHKREMTLMGSRNATAEDFEMVVQAMRDGLVPTDALRTTRVALSELPAALPAWMNADAGVIKALVDC